VSSAFCTESQIQYEKPASKTVMDGVCKSFSALKLPASYRLFATKCTYGNQAVPQETDERTLKSSEKTSIPGDAEERCAKLRKRMSSQVFCRRVIWSVSARAQKPTPNKAVILSWLKWVRVTQFSVCDRG